MALSQELATAALVARLADRGLTGAVALLPLASSVVDQVGPRLAAARQDPEGGGAFAATMALLADISVKEQPRLDAMLGTLALIDADLNTLVGVDPNDPLRPALPPLVQTSVGQRAAPLLTRLESVLPAVQAGVQAVLALPDAFPDRSSVRYALIAQKTAEPRATGGFWGNIGFIEIEGGRPVGFDYFRSQFLDRPQRLRLPPPTPLVRYMGMDQWMLRDANWWPHFPTSVNQFQEFLRHDTGLQADGVIAFDETVLQGILKIVGGVQVPEYGERVDANNVLDRLEFYAYGPGDRAAQARGRRPFFEFLASKVISQIAGLDPDRVQKLGKLLLDLLAEKHILMYYAQPPAQALMTRLGWDGRIDTAPGDYLAVVDTNVDYTEPYPGVEKITSYEVEIRPDGELWAYLTIDYANTNARSTTVEAVRSVQRDFADYLRVYVPAGSVLQRAFGIEGDAETWEEGSRTVFGGYFLLKPGEQRRIELHYQLPGSLQEFVRSGFYLITVQRQPGTPVRTVTVRVTLPGQQPAAGEAALVPVAVLSASGTVAPAVGTHQGRPSLSYAFDLRADIRLAIPLPGAEVPPRPAALRRLALAAPQLPAVPASWVRADLALPPEELEARAPVLHRAPTPEPTFALPTLVPAPAQALASVPPPTRAPPPAPPPAAQPTVAEPVPGPSVRLPEGIIVRLPAPRQLLVPKLGLDVPVLPTSHNLAEWETAADAVGWLTGTANPGERGNLVLAGHNDARGAVFARLEELEPGDEVVVVSDDGRFRYVVARSQVLPPNLRASLYPSIDARATLVTCTPSPSNELRHIVTALLVGPT